jgi:hypothetical protein
MLRHVCAAGLGAVLLWGAAARAQDCTPSPWGPDDEIGAANRVTPERVMAALDLVTQGQVHPLGIVIDPSMPAFPPRRIMLQVVQPSQHFGRDLTEDYGWPMSYNDDAAQLWWGVGPQIDGLGHLGEEGTFYNCNRGSEFADVTGLRKLGIHNVPPLVGRGVLLDMAEHFGVPALESGQPIEAEVVLIHTGWTDAKLGSEPDVWVATEPGITNDAAEYLASLRPMAVGADTWGVDVVPAPDGDKTFHAHVTFLKDSGIYILETMNTGRLAQEDVREFLFVLGQPRMKGAVQMMVNPVAMW